MLSACPSLPRQQKSNLSSSLSQAELPVLCFAFVETDLYMNPEWPKTPNPPCLSLGLLVCTSSPGFLILLLSFAKEGSGNGEEEATVELYALCLQYILFSAVSEHSGL